MAIKKRGNQYEAEFKYRDASVVLGLFDCRSCAQNAVEIASRCVSTNYGPIQHGTNEYAVSDARKIGILEKLEDHFGFEISERMACQQYERETEELIEWKLEKALKKAADSAIKRRDLYQAKKLMRTVPLVEVEYPAVPMASILATEDGSGVPESSGVYFVWDGPDVVYVGQAVNLRNRVRLRHERICDGERISWLEFPCAVLNYAEAFYIGIVCPCRNFGKFQQRHESVSEVGCD